MHGPGRVGKRVLLYEFGRLATAAGASVVAIDGRDLKPSRPILLVDSYEVLAPLDTWLRLVGTMLLPESLLSTRPADGLRSC